MKTIGSDETDNSVELPPENLSGSGEPSVELDRLKLLLSVGEERGNLVYVLRAAEAMDFTPIISTLTWDRLQKERRPLITRLHSRRGWGDFVILLGVSGDEALLVSGTLRVLRIKREQFCRVWNGWVVILQQRTGSFGA